MRPPGAYSIFKLSHIRIKQIKDSEQPPPPPKVVPIPLTADLSIVRVDSSIPVNQLYLS